MTKRTSSLESVAIKMHTLSSHCGAKAHHLQKSTWANGATLPSEGKGNTGMPRLKDEMPLGLMDEALGVDIKKENT